MPDKHILTRAAVYGGIIMFLLGEAFDIYWHSRYLTLAVPGIPHLMTVHLPILIGASITLSGGILGTLVRPRRAAVLAGAVIVILGAAIQIAGFVYTAWKFAHNVDANLGENLLLYGLYAAGPGAVLIGIGLRKSGKAPSPAETTEPPVPAQRP